MNDSTNNQPHPPLHSDALHQSPSELFANQNIQKHPIFFNKASTSTRLAWQKHNTVGTRDNKVGTIIYHFVSQESKAKDERAVVARRE
jgi:hypothetical protein